MESIPNLTFSQPNHGSNDKEYLSDKKAVTWYYIFFAVLGKKQTFKNNQMISRS